MMVSALRSRAVACVLVLFTFIGTTGAWHASDDDPDFATAVIHDHSTHQERLSAANSSPTPSHCAICHWLQGFRIDTVPGNAVAGDDAGDDLLVSSRRHPPQFLVRVDVPSRAPPPQFS